MFDGLEIFVRKEFMYLPMVFRVTREDVGTIAEGALWRCGRPPTEAVVAPRNATGALVQSGGRGRRRGICPDRNNAPINVE